MTVSSRVGFPSWLEVDLDAITANAHFLTALVGPASQVAAVVKAQAYGLGATQTAIAAVRGGATRLAVARVREGVLLRQAGINVPILVLSAIVEPEIDLCLAHELTPTLADPGLAQLVANAAEGLGRAWLVHIKMDTGLTRYGALESELVQLADFVASSSWLYPEGLYTHFSSSDESDLSITYAQLDRFRQGRELLRARGCSFDLYHAANSGGTIMVPESRLDLVRTGITLAGYTPSDVVSAEGLTPSLALKAALARVYDLPVGTTVGYGRTYTARSKIRAGLVPLGYADGLPRSMSDRGSVLVRGTLAPIIGRISMDQCVVDLSAAPTAELGDEVVALGRQGDQEITLDQFARWADTIPHEAMTRIGIRVPRVYLQAGRVERVGFLDSPTS